VRGGEGELVVGDLWREGGRSGGLVTLGVWGGGSSSLATGVGALGGVGDGVAVWLLVFLGFGWSSVGSSWFLGSR